jgi:gliding motility-associated-like protein
VLNFVPGVINSGTICQGNSFQLMASGGTSYQWWPVEELNNPASYSAVTSPSANVIFTVEINNNSFGFSCSRQLTTSVHVNPKPTAAFDFTTNPCGGGVSFFDRSFDEVVSWQWNLAPAETRTIANPYHFYKNGGTFTVSLVATNIHSCSDEIRQIIQVGVPPAIAVNSGTAICFGDSVQLNASGGIGYAWSPLSGLDHGGIASPIASPTVSTEYSVVITTTLVVNNEACKFLLTTGVRVDRLSVAVPVAKAFPPVISDGEQSTLVYSGDPGASVTWFPLASTLPGSGYTVVARPLKPTTYTAVAQKGVCRHDITVYVEVHTKGCLPDDAFLPNTFTPNGDGQNDVFRVQGVKLSEVYFAVYNRWGEKVYETSDKAGAWDGSYRGKELDAGVFGYYVEFGCLNGGKAMKKGNVTLVR